MNSKTSYAIIVLTILLMATAYHFQNSDNDNSSHKTKIEQPTERSAASTPKMQLPSSDVAALPVRPVQQTEKASFGQSLDQTEDLGKVDDWLENFPGLDTKGWLKKTGHRIAITPSLKALVERSLPHPRFPALHRLVDIKTGHLFHLESDDDYINYLQELAARMQSNKLVFQNRNFIPQGHKGILNEDIPFCSIKIADLERFINFPVKLISFFVKSVEHPVTIPGGFVGIKIIANNSKDGVESISCFIKKDEANPLRYQNLQTAHLSATFGTNSRVLTNDK